MRNMTLFRFKVALYLVFTEELRITLKFLLDKMIKKGRGLEFLQLEKCYVIKIASENVQPVHFTMKGSREAHIRLREFNSLLSKIQFDVRRMMSL